MIVRGYHYIPNANNIIIREQIKYNGILTKYQIPCHSQAARIKTFSSAIQSSSRKQIIDIFSIYDLIAFRYIFYNLDDLYKFYHHVKLNFLIYYEKDYIINPKSNNYKALHIRYKNTYKNSSIKQLECQLFIINDYYDSLYGKSQYISKNYYNLYVNNNEIIW